MSMFPPVKVPEWTLGDRLVKARTDAGLSQEDLAKLLEISRATINRYERGRNVPPGPTLKLWALYCGVPLDWLRQGFSSPTTEPIPPAVGNKPLPRRQTAGGTKRRRRTVASMSSYGYAMAA